MVNAILAKRVNHIVTKGDNPAWPKGSKSRGFSTLDGDPDSIDDQINPDTYNSACQRTNCPGRGKICGSDIALKSHEIATLRELKSGKTAKEIAASLCISEPAVKSRIEKLKDKFNVTNAVALIGIVTELGI